jgi:hypothetical protein
MTSCRQVGLIWRMWPFTSRRKVLVLVIAILMCALGSTSRASDQPTLLPEKTFEAVVAQSQGLTQWAFALFAGSLLTIVGTSHFRPSRLSIRLTYLLFLFGWVFLAFSIYYGTRVQRVYLAYLFSNQPFEALRDSMGADYKCQMHTLELGLVFFGTWIIIYLLWWIFEKDGLRKKHETT